MKFRPLKSPLRSGLPNITTHLLAWSAGVRYCLMLVRMIHMHNGHSQVVNDQIGIKNLIDLSRPRFGRTWAF